MNGVNIIDEYIAHDMPLVSLIVMCIFLLILIVGLVSTLVHSIVNRKRLMVKNGRTIWWRDIILLIVMTLMIIGLITVGILAYVFDAKYEYIVTVSDDVGLNEFAKHYKIIEQDGMQYTVRPIESGDN